MYSLQWYQNIISPKISLAPYFVWVYHIRMKMMVSYWCIVSHQGPYSRKRNNFSLGISLTTWTWFLLLLLCKLFFYQLKRKKINVWRSWKLKSLLFHYYFPYFSISETPQKKKKTNKQTNLLVKTYSWNKVWFKLFLFQEYGPNCLEFRYERFNRISARC